MSITTEYSKTGIQFAAFFDGKENRLLGRIKTDKPKLVVPPFASYLQNFNIPVLDISKLPDYDRYQVNVPILDQDGIGCHDDKTEVLTNNGWKLWSEYNWEDPIGTMNPYNSLLEFQKPTHKHIYEYNGDMYYSSNRCIDFALTPNHRMFVRKWNERKRTLSSEYTIDQIQNCGCYFGLPHATRGYVGVNLDKISIGNYKNISGDDFVALVSIVLSDGWVGSTDRTKNMVGFCCFNNNRYLKVKEIAQRLGFIEQSSRPGVWTKNDPVLSEWFKQNCYNDKQFNSPYKKIPYIIRGISQNQINIFIEFFGDKNSTQNGGYCFSSTSKQLTDDMQELLLRIGKRGSVYQREARNSNINGRVISKENCHDENVLIERKTDRLSIEKKKHLYTDKYNGVVYCATVPNGLLVTRRNNSILVSGNSCCGHSHAAMMMKARDRANYTFQGLSADSLYAQVNGGKDGGSDPADCITALEQNGICLLSEVPDQWILWQNVPQSAKDNAKRFRIVANGVYQCSNFAELVTADYLGFSVTMTINVGANFGPGSDGVVGFWPGYANHCISAGESKRTVKGVTQFRFRNSWGTSWGDNGCAWLTADHIDKQPGVEIYALMWTLEDPQDQTNVPTVIS